jgi:riboflavin synthase
MPETVRRTALSALKAGSEVNLERALTLQTRLGGHIVQGHVDGIGTVIDRQADDNALWLTIECGADLMRYIISKGSITIQGVSLTVAKVTPSTFSVSLIPHTQGVTTLHSARVGDKVNLETDIIAKYVEKMLSGDKDDAGKMALYRNFMMS